MDIVSEEPAASRLRAFHVRLSPRAASAAAAAAAAALAAWLLLPALTPAHLEGCTAALAALGVHLAEGTMADFDRLQPLNAEYYGLTKLGAVLAVAALVGLEIGSDLALRLMMWTGFAALLAGSAFLARKWSGARWPFVLAPLLLLPGIFESAFIYNDNVPSAGLAAVGLCLLYGRHPLSLAAAGLLLGLAVLTRTDTVLACACVPIIIVERFGRTRRTLAALATVGACAALALLGPLAFFQASIFDVLKVGSAAVRIWNRPTSGLHSLIMGLYFLGLPGLLLAGAGLAALIRRRDNLAVARLLCGPLLLLALLGDKLWEIRQLLALAPFLCALAAIGLESVYGGADSAVRLWLRPAVAVIAFLSLAGPSTGARMQDGPRVASGRIWAVPLWRSWQEAPRRDLATLERVVGSAVPGRPLVLVSDEWNEDRYLHLKLLDAGYTLAGTQPLPQPCRPVAERFTRDGRKVLHLRLHHSMVSYWREIKEERLARWGLPCLDRLGDADTLFVATSARMRSLLPGSGPAVGPRSDDPRRDPAVASLSYGPIVAVPLDRVRRQQLVAAYRREAESIPGAAGEPLPSASDAAAASRRRTRFPG